MKATQYNPDASSANAVVYGGARFTLLTSKMVRLEWCDDGQFEDRATLAVVNRRMPEVTHSVEQSGNILTIRTDDLVLQYVDDGKAFSKVNLKILFEHGGVDTTWRPYMKDRQNLRGTLRTLDELDADRRIPFDTPYDGDAATFAQAPRVDLPYGFLSRSGWSVFDDSASVVLEQRAGGCRWVDPRPEGKRQDLYFMAYGADYKTCLRDVSLVLGRQVLPPKYALGYWYCRYWAYTDVEVKEIVEQFDGMGIPLDVFIIDMDWHLPGWTGYTWDRRFFPAPEKLLDWLHGRKLKIALNLHPADGVAPKEEAYEAVCRDMGLDPDRGGSIPFDCTDPDYVDAYFRHLHHPKEDIGVDFWWIDWQQGEETGVAGLDPLPWLNQLHWEDQALRRPTRRPLNFSRYGGPGGGRYPIGFSGDTYITWRSLKFQLYFTPTASNALYGYWSHDIGGHMGGAGTPEMYVRWVQFGAYSPILRTHSTKGLANDRRPWTFSEPYNLLVVDAIKARYELVPYIYSEMQAGVESGVSLLRPMYYYHPEDEEAYRAKYQYYFGESMVVSPIAEPVDPITETVRHKTWLPAGQWFDTALGMLIEGGRWYQETYLLSEVPTFVRPGAVIPGQFGVRRTGDGSVRSMLVTAYPGDNGEYTLYEDDGSTTAYLDGASASIPLTNVSEGDLQTVCVHPIRGTYRGMVKNRRLQIRIPIAVPPREVRIGGDQLPWDADGAELSWRYDAYGQQIVVDVGRFSVTEGISVTVLHNDSAKMEAIVGLKGLAARLKRICALNGMAVPIASISEGERIGIDAGQAYHRIDLDPTSFTAEMRRLRSLLPALAKEFGALVGPVGRGGAPGQAQLLEKARDMAQLIRKQFG